MVRLTREVRFGIGLEDADTIDGENGFAGRPALAGIGAYLIVRVTLEGEPDEQSGYVRNIKDIDAAIRSEVVPFFQTTIQGHVLLTDQRLPRHVHALLEDANALPGASIVSIDVCLSPFLSLNWCASEPDMIRLSQTFEFSAAHRLHNPNLSAAENVAAFGKCNNPHGHGHNYILKVTLAGMPDKLTGQLLPVDTLERIVDERIIDAFDHKHLNIEVPEFKTLNPTVEHIAMVIYRRLAPAIQEADARLASVTVWETPKTFAEYAEDE